MLQQIPTNSSCLQCVLTCPHTRLGETVSSHRTELLEPPSHKSFLRVIRLLKFVEQLPLIQVNQLRHCTSTYFSVTLDHIMNFGNVLIYNRSPWTSSMFVLFHTVPSPEDHLYHLNTQARDKALSP
ncbi:hypothetical protein TNCV_1417791 [Trichonephila clavipes]|nr:hypothetical protein TNCV_1417791 [Trichonephila clavipes]